MHVTRNVFLALMALILTSTTGCKLFGGGGYEDEYLVRVRVDAEQKAAFQGRPVLIYVLLCDKTYPAPAPFASGKEIADWMLRDPKNVIADLKRLRRAYEHEFRPDAEDSWDQLFEDVGDMELGEDAQIFVVGQFADASQHNKQYKSVLLGEDLGGDFLMFLLTPTTLELEAVGDQ